MFLRWHHGWTVVLCAFLIAMFGWGLGFCGSSVYLAELTHRHGWSAATIGSAITAYYLAGGTCILATGDVIARFGAGPTVLAAGTAMALGVAGLTVIDRPWQLYPAFLLMSLGWAGLSGAAVNTIVAPWFDRRRGLAISLALNGASAGGIVVQPILMRLIAVLGFGAGTVTVAFAMLAVLLPVALALRPAPPALAAATADDDWSRRQALGEFNFLTVTIPFALGLTAQVGFVTHQVALLLPALGPATTAWCVAAAAVAAVVGRVATGFMVDRIDLRRAAAANFLWQIGCLLLLAGAATPLPLAFGCIGYRLGVGNMITFPGLIVQREFPARHFPRLVSLALAINQYTFAFGPGLLGWLRELSGGYGAALGACVLLQAAAAALVLLRRPQA